jgi:hypothetical protein
MKRREFITLLGGVLLAGSALLATAAFAQSIGRWTAGTSMPSARTEVAVAEVGGKIYVVGGFGGERELEIYDSAADRWSRGASIPRALHHAAAVGWQDKLYVVGGFVEDWTPTDDVHEYDPASDRWRRLAALPTPRGALAAAVLGGKIHAVGGIGWRGRSARGLRSRRQPVDGARLCPDGARPLGGHRDGRTPLRCGRPHRRQLFAEFGVERGV